VKVFKICVFFFLLAGSMTDAEDVVSWVRVYTPDEEAFYSLAYRDDLDVAATRYPGYVDLVAQQSTLDRLASTGLSYEYLQYDCLSPESFGGRAYDGYRNYDELVADLNALASGYPDICTLSNLGQGHVGLGDIWLLKVSDDVAGDEPDEADLFIVGCHHAREPMSVEVPVSFATYLCEGYATDPDVQNIVDNLEFYILPCLNPDGWVYDDVEGTRNWWRKNGYDWPGDEPLDYDWGEGTGVDPNRNYTYMWGYDDEGSSPNWYSQIYRGPSAGSEPENQAVITLAEEKSFDSAITFHQYGELILWPWGYKSTPTPDDYRFEEIAQVMYEEIYNHLGYGYYCSQLGTINGDLTDYLYGNSRTLGFTIELNESFYPDDSEIEPTCAMMNDVLREWAEWCLDEFTGVEIAYFEARWRDSKVVALTWDVSTDTETAGFNVYRESDIGCSRERINRELVYGQGPYVYVDADVNPNLSYDYYLEAIDENGVPESFGPVHIDAAEGSKKAFALYQSKPNPSEGKAVIAFDIPADAAVELVLYDVAGRTVTTLVDDTLPAGEHTADVIGLPSGVYVYRLDAGDFTAARKMVIK